MREIPKNGIHDKNFMSEIIGVATQHLTSHHININISENKSKIFKNKKGIGYKRILKSEIFGFTAQYTTTRHIKL